jgi:hypothetical protein
MERGSSQGTWLLHQVVSDSPGFSGKFQPIDVLLLFRLRLDSVFQRNSSNSAWAARKSCVSNPSVNQP